MSEILDKLPQSATESEDIVNEDGRIDARSLSRTLGAVISECLSGRIQTSRAHAAIRGMQALISLADAVRRSSDSAQPLLQVTAGPSDDDGPLQLSEGQQSPH